VKLVVAGVIALLLKLLLAACTLGTNDARTWEHDLVTLRTSGFAELYRSGVQYDSPAGRLSQRQAFIHPPAVLHALPILGNPFWLRAVCALADACTLTLLWSMFGNRAQILVLALSPISILISGFHGNTDPIMMFFLVTAAFFAERGNAARAGVAFGLACSVKLVPLIFAPAILLYLPGLRPRLRWLAATAAVWVVLSMSYLAQEPALILRSMLGYSGATGLWGFSLVSTLLGAGRIYDPAAKWIALLAASCVPLMLRKRLFAQCGFIAFTFLLLSPGFGLQYLAWTVPWTVMLQRRAMIAYHAMAGTAALAVYAAASQNTSAGVYADLLNPAYFPVLILMGLVCWVTIAAIIGRLNIETPWVDRNPALPATPGDGGSIATVPDC
jgi:Mannosyltransferase (PIG-M)